MDSDEEFKPKIDSEQVTLPKKRRRVDISEDEDLPTKTRKIESTGLTPGISALKIDNPKKGKVATPVKAKVVSPVPKLDKQSSNTFSIADSDILAAVNEVDSDLLNGYTLVLSGIM